MQRLPLKAQSFQQLAMRLAGRAHRPGRRASGWPIDAMCTRTWWVRPVSSVHSTSAASRSSCSRFQWVTARLPRPSATIAIFLRLVRRAGERGVDGALPPALGHAGDDRQVAAVDAVGGELPGQAFVGDVGLGDDQQARRVLVDAVDDAGPRDAADARQAAAAMVEQGVDQRAVEIAGGGMDDQARRACRRPADARPRTTIVSGMSCALVVRGLGLRDRRAEALRRRGPWLAGSRTALRRPAARRCGSAPSAARATGSAPRRRARGRAASRRGPARARTSIV